MSAENIHCVLLADRHHGLTEGIRGLLETLFDAVVMVADEPSLQESAVRLQPSAAVGAGSNVFVLKRSISTDLLPAIEAVQEGKTFVSAGVEGTGAGQTGTIPPGAPIAGESHRLKRPYHESHHRRWSSRRGVLRGAPAPVG